MVRSVVKASLNLFLNHSRLGSATTVFLVLLSIMIFTLETEFSNSNALAITGRFIAALFGIEYFSRIWVADIDDPVKGARLRYIKSFSGIVDLLAFFPALFLYGGSPSVVLRLLRVTRLMQILKIDAVAKSLSRLKTAFYECKGELGISAVIAVSLIFVGALLMYIAEGDLQPDAFGSVPRALWWSMATLTTVGYGDVYPITSTGKLIASCLAFVGIGAVALPAGIIASALSRKESTGK